MKHLKRIAALLAVVCIAAGVYFGLIAFNFETFNNLFHNREKQVMEGNDLQIDAFDISDGGVWTANEDSSITIRFQESLEVRNLLFPIGNGVAPSHMKVLYTVSPDEPFSEELFIDAQGTVQNADYLLLVDQNVAALRIFPGAYESFRTNAIPSIIINPRRFHVHSYALLLSVMAAVALVVAADFISDRKEIVRELRAMHHYRFLLYDLVTRDIKTKYRRSVLGLLWSVLNPLLMMLVLTAVFSTIFRYRTSDFSVYYLTGYLMFNFVMESTTFSMSSILQSAGLIKKVYIPKFVFPLEKCLYALVNMLFSLIAAVIVFLVVGVTPHPTMLLFFVPIFYLFIFNFGVSLILATLNTFFRDVGYLYNVFITVWMYLTPIIYPVSILPPWLLPIIRLNPLYHYVEYFRDVTLYGTLPGWRENLICISFSLVFLLVGLLVFRKKQDRFIFYI